VTETNKKKIKLQANKIKYCVS